MAEKRHVRLDYFSDMGQAAYLTVSELQDSALSDLYFQLSAQFLTMQKILQAMRGIHSLPQEEDRITVTTKNFPMH
jgi:hypothetical protein